MQTTNKIYCFKIMSRFAIEFFNFFFKILFYQLEDFFKKTVQSERYLTVVK